MFVSSSLTAEEKDRLTKTAWLTKETALSQEADSDSVTIRPDRYKARSLYEPTDALRELGLPLLAWKTSKWRSTSEEAKFLFSIGLRRHPDIEEVLGLAADTKVFDTSQKALTYFLSHFEGVYGQAYQPIKHGYAFVPILQNGMKAHVKPTEAYSSPGSAILGYPVLHPDFQLHSAKFKLASDPSPSNLVAKLVNSPPSSTATAIPIFAYLAGQASRREP